MKNILLVFTLFFAYTTIAQTTEINEENIPRFGERLFMYLLDETTPTYSSTNGENAYWDYSNVTSFEDQTLICNVVPSESTQNGTLFPPTVSTVYGDLMALYNSDDEQGLYTHGMVFNDPEYGAVKGVFSDPVLVCNFPFTIGDENVSEISGTATINSNQGNFNGPFSGTVTTSIDGIGTLELTNITYENVVRFVNIGNFTISAFGYNVILSSEQYSYYNFEVSNLPLFTHTYVMYKSIGAVDPINEYVFVLSTDNPNQELTGPTFTLDNVPSIGEEQTMFNVSGNTDPLEDIVGEDVTWDFSTILGSTIVEKEIIVGTPNSPLFSQTDNMVHYEDVLARYMTDNVYGSNVKGTIYKDASLNDVVDFYGSNTQLHNYPFGYGAMPFLNGFSGKTSFSIGSISLDEKPMTGSTLSFVDGYGTLKLPYNDYQNVVRHKHIDTIRIEQANFPADLLKIGTVYSYYDFELSNLPIFVHSKVVYKYANQSSNIHRYVKVLSLEPPYECDIELTAEIDYIGDCIDDDQTFGATLLITGGQEDDSFTIIDNHGNTLTTNAIANEPFIVSNSQYNAGVDDVTFTAYKNGDEVCLSNATIISPEVCYYCDVEILTELNFTGECVSPQGTFGVILTITGGLPGDLFTLKDSYGTTISTNIQANNPFTISEGYYPALQSVTFYAHRNVDIECDTEVLVEAPLCYGCDIEIAAEIYDVGECIDEDQTYGVTLFVTGGLPDDEFTIVDSNGETLFSNAVANEIYTLPSDQYNAGEDITFTVYINGFESCWAGATVQSPEICYYCDIELDAQINIPVDCIDEGGTFGVTLTISGGLPGDNFTIKDENGITYSTAATTAVPFVVSNSFYPVGTNVNFIINRNADPECIALATVVSPEICNYCDIELTAEIDYDEECIDEDETYSVILTITGGMDGDEFTVVDNNGTILTSSALANEPFTASIQYAAGDDVLFSANRNEDETCVTTASVQSPEICYYCDIELNAVINYSGDCVNENSTYSITLTVSGGLPGDLFTITDNNGVTLTSNATANNPFTTSSNYYTPGNETSFTVIRNADNECISEITIDTPEICYTCDLTLVAEINNDADCINEDETYSVTLIVSGGLSNDTFTIVDNFGNTITTAAVSNNPVVTSEDYIAGENVTFTSYRNEDETCTTTASVQSPEICYYCDIEIVAVLNYSGDCVNESSTYSVTLTVSGGLPGDSFTIIDNNGSTLTSNATANNPFATSSGYYTPGNEVSFVVNRNADEECIAETTIESPEICYTCDITLSAEINFDEDCIDPDVTYGATLIISGGLADDTFTVIDNYGNTLTTTAIANNPIITDDLYNAGQNVTFTVSRNEDSECLSMATVSSPSICYYCDYQLSAEIIPNEDCVDEDGTYDVLLTIIGGQEGDEFTITDNITGIISNIASVDEPITVAYNAGENPSFTLDRNDDLECSVIASIQSPEICYYCDIELNAVLNYNGDCVDENSTYSITLVVSGGLPGDSFTITDNSGNTLTSNATANNPFTTSSSYYTPGDDVSFTVIRNADNECIAEAIIETPEICYYCDLSLIAEINNVGDCIDEDDSYSVSLVVSGGLSDDTFTIVDSYGNTIVTDAVSNNPVVTNEDYNAGEDVTFTVYRNEDETCIATASVESPEICYYCDITLTAELNYTGDCIDENVSYSVTFVVSGGLPGDTFTITDNQGSVLTTNAIANAQFTTSNTYYNSGDDTNFTVHRNIDEECLAEASFESPEICYECDITLTAEINNVEECIDEDDSYSVTLIISGGVEGDEFTIMDSNGELITSSALANEPFITSAQYTAGEDVSFTVHRNEDETCTADASVQSPEICYYCDIELSAEINFDGDCINEGETFGATLTITGGQPGDQFTIKDDNGAIFTSIASANEPYTISSSYYNAGTTNVTFIVNRNSDVDCIAEATIEAPEFCYSCDIVLSAELDIEDDCIDEDETYGVILTISGGVEGDEFTITDSNGDILTSSALANEPFITSAQYSAGEDISFTVHRNEDETCTADASVQSPEICYYCDIELTAEIDFNEDCIDEDETFGATLIITGGLPGDNFTLTDSDGAIFTAIALANEPFTVPSNYYQAGQDVTFIVYRNADNSCFAEASIESPEICYYCDIELVAEIDYEGECIDADEMYGVILTVSGGIEGDEFTIIDSNGDTLTSSATVNDPFISTALYNAGDDVSFTVHRNDDETCIATAIVVSPEICYICDIEVVSDINGVEDCIDEGETYGVTLTISGGQPDDVFTIIDNNGIIFTTDAVADEPFVISSSYLAGQNVTFTVYRNADISCTTDLLVESPEICLYCEVIPELELVEISDTTALITWQSVSGVAEMYVQWREVGDSQWNTVEVSGQTDLLLEDLSPGTDYEIRAYVICDNELEGELSDILNITTSTSGLKEEIFVNVRLYPNPATHELIIEIDNPQLFEIEINDMVGKVVYKGQIEGAKSINVNHFKPGVYLVNVSDKDWSKVFRFVKR